MVDILIIRNKLDVPPDNGATVITNWVGDGLKAFLEGKGYSVTDLSDIQATPANVQNWLNYSDMRTKKLVIGLDHGSCDAFYGENDSKTIMPVIAKANCAALVKDLHVYLLACSTNGDGCVGPTAVQNGCLSWCAYTEPVYAMKSQEFKDCIWSYIVALADGKTLEEALEVLKKAYQDRDSLSFVFGYNLARLKLIKVQSGMTINNRNRGTIYQTNKKIDMLYVYGPQNRNVWVHVKDIGWKLLWNDFDCQVESMLTIATHAKADDRFVSFWEQDNKIMYMYVM